MLEEQLFKYLHLVNEARAEDGTDEDLYKRQQKVCDAIEKALGIQECSEKPTNNIYYTTNNYHESFKDAKKNSCKPPEA